MKENAGLTVFAAHILSKPEPPLIAGAKWQDNYNNHKVFILQAVDLGADWLRLYRKWDNGFERGEETRTICPIKGLFANYTERGGSD